MNHSLTLAVSALLTSSLAMAQSPARLDYADVTGGVTFTGSTIVPFVAGHQSALRIAGSPGDLTMLVASILPPQAPVTIQGVDIGVDLGSALVLWNGLVDPNAPVVGAGGLADFPFVVPQFASSFVWHLQALTIGAAGLLLTDSLRLATSDATLLHIASGADTAHPLGVGNGALLSLATPLDWQTFWTLHAPNDPQPVVDFATSFVLARLGGEGRCLGAGITNATLGATGVLQVDTTIVYGCGAPSPFPIPDNRPFDIVVLPAAWANAPIAETLTILVAP